MPDDFGSPPARQLEASGEPYTLTAEDRRMDGELETEIIRLRAENERLEQEIAAYRARLATADAARRAAVEVEREVCAKIAENKIHGTRAAAAIRARRIDNG